jgi:hypothetical protein
MHHPRASLTGGGLILHGAPPARNHPAHGAAAQGASLERG